MHTKHLIILLLFGRQGEFCISQLLVSTCWPSEKMGVAPGVIERRPVQLFITGEFRLLPLEGGKCDTSRSYLHLELHHPPQEIGERDTFNQ
jgi:hypothetical protein